MNDLLIIQTERIAQVVGVTDKGQRWLLENVSALNKFGNAMIDKEGVQDFVAHVREVSDLVIEVK